MALAACGDGANEASPTAPSPRGTTMPVAVDPPAEVEPDLSTTEGACAAVADAIEDMKSSDPSERANGAALAGRVWDYSATNDEVSEGMRRTCGPSVVDMLYAADIHP